MLFSDEICNAFHQQAPQYEAAARAQRVIGDALFERLSYIKLNPRYVLDLGCGTGLFSKRLEEQYPNAVIVGLDKAHGMLREAQASNLNHASMVEADMHTLPFQDGVFDLVFSNQVFHWSRAWPKLMREVSRVMRVDGCLMFSTLGPDTFLELRESDNTAYAHANDFMDMHELGDILLAEHWVDPVVDMDKLMVHYDSWPKLLRSLRSQGVRNINSKRNPGLTGRARWAAFEAAVQTHRTEDGKYPLTYEVVYGHAWKGAQHQTEQGVETSIPLSALRASLNRL
jgi:malonyl-CoA O-methyltransferase